MNLMESTVKDFKTTVTEAGMSFQFINRQIIIKKIKKYYRYFL